MCNKEGISRKYFGLSISSLRRVPFSMPGCVLSRGLLAIGDSFKGFFTKQRMQIT
jgi:hypothetical protein